MLHSWRPRARQGRTSLSVPVGRREGRDVATDGDIPVNVIGRLKRLMSFADSVNAQDHRQVGAKHGLAG